MDAIATILAQLSLEDKASLSAGQSMFGTASVEAVGLQPVQMADGPMGVASTRVDERDVSVLTPCGVALAASWDPDLVRRIGALVGAEARKLGVNVLLAPNLGIPRSPLAGRAFENFSEDPYLTGVLGAAWIEGIQSQGVGACAKHLVCNDSETQRDQMNAVVDERALREVYLLPFEMAAASGAWGMLMAYNKLDGTHCVEHTFLIQDVLKGEWGFDGFVVSDWFGTFDTERSALAGLDLEMPGPARVFGSKLAEAVAQGRVPEQRVDDAAGRVLRLAQRTGKLGAVEAQPARQGNEDAIASLLIEAAAAGFVLLKNKGGLLPREAAPGRIAVIGPNAASPCYQGGTFAKIGLRPGVSTPLDAIRARYADHCEITYAPGVEPDYRLPPMDVRPAQPLQDGERGMTVGYYSGHDFSGLPLAVETRNANSLTWFGVLPGVGPMVRSAGIRASGIFEVVEPGVHRFFVGGTGSVRLWIDGELLLAEDKQIEPKDLMGVLKSGVASWVDVDLSPGAQVRIDAELLTSPGRAQGFWYGVKPPAEPEAMLGQAEALARQADTVFLIVGETSDSGVESMDREDTQLPASQIALIGRVLAANPNTVVIVNAAHAVDLSCADAARAVMITWYPGEGFGEALAAVLAGDLEPSGRLPVTFAAQEADYPAFDLTPDAAGDLHLTDSWQVGYKGLQAKGTDPRHAFGEGLGYGDVRYEGVTITEPPGGGFDVAVSVRNVGRRATKAVVQVYVSAVESDAPVLQLRGFAALRLAPGAADVAQIHLPPRAFCHWQAGEGWRVTPGRHAIHVGPDVRRAEGYDFVAPTLKIGQQGRA